MRGGGGGVSAAEVFGPGSEGQGSRPRRGPGADWAGLAGVEVGLLGGGSASGASCGRTGGPAGSKS